VTVQMMPCDLVLLLANYDLKLEEISCTLYPRIFYSEIKGDLILILAIIPLLL
jgi:hypothetical protein